MTPLHRPRLTIGISGASGPHHGIALLEVLRDLGTVETHLVMSTAARRTIRLEAARDPTDVAALADAVHNPHDLAAPISSGTFRSSGMAIAPCSMKTLAAIATGHTDDLLSRAADVTLKERRPLVLVTRETPLNLIHLRNMTAVTEAGATVLPPVPGFHTAPTSIDDLIAHTTGKVLDQFGIDHHLSRRWNGPHAETERHRP